MTEFISRMITKYADQDLEKGQELYRKYFIHTTIYEKYRKEVDEILKQSGLEAVIVNA